ncbi:T9SS type A sorting domain-containing protein [Aequorivita viscosa]|nr:T9SS type A sorting domain-containing protein [Aequorivita viscosa]
MKKNILTSLVLVLITISLYAQDPNILWQRTIGGSSIDIASVIKSTLDGGFILGGSSTSDISGEKSENSRGGDDYWIIKLDSAGEIEWQRTIGGSGNDFLNSIALSSDGGYVLGGYSDSNISGEKTENSLGDVDGWVLKLDSSGNILWQNTIGGTNADTITAVIATSDGGYLLNCYSNSNSSPDKSENSLGSYDYWIVKIDNTGNIIWENTIGGDGADSSLALANTTDGGFIVGGASFSNISGDKTENTNGLQDYWVIKLDGSGNIQWQHTIGGNSTDIPRSLIQTADGGYLIGGESGSDISGDKSENNIGLGDFWIVKLDSAGNIQWQNTIGGNKTDVCYALIQKNNGNFIVGGGSESDMIGDKTEENIGGQDYWIVELDSTGTVIAQNTIGGTENEILTSLSLSNNSELIIGGASQSSISGDKTEDSRGNFDYWILYHNLILGIEENPLIVSITLYPNPTKNTLQLNTQDQTINQINIYTITGSKVVQLDVDTVSPTVDVSSLASGLYYVQLYSGKNVALKKFVKE